MSRGGYRQPNNPAPASGPGALSRRTDGGPEEKVAARWIPQDEYGAASDLMDVQGQAPMQGQSAPQPVDTHTPLDAPTQRPSEPITAGAPFGPGPGPAPMAEPAAAQPRDDVSLIVRAAFAAHPSPELGAMVNWLNSQGR